MTACARANVMGVLVAKVAWAWLVAKVIMAT